MHKKRIHITELQQGMWIDVMGNLVMVTLIIPNPGDMTYQIVAENHDVPSDLLKNKVDLTVDAFCYVDTYQVH